MPSMYEDNQEAAAKVVQEELLEEYSRVHTSAETQRRIDNLDLALNELNPHDDLHVRGVGRLRKLCRLTGCLPASCHLEGAITLVDQHPIHRTALSDVWHGKLGVRGQAVALKSLRLFAEEQIKVKKSFLHEVITWKHLRHAHIVPFVGTTDILPVCIVSGWMEFGSIVSFLRDNPSESRVRHVADIVNGLLFMHSRGIVHGDLKGSNILVDSTRRSRLADFGLTVLLHNTGTITTTTSSHGTTRWMAPEFFDETLAPNANGRPTRATDMYAFAMVVYEIFSGLLPFSHITAEFRIPMVVIAGERPKRPTGDENSTGLTDAIWSIVQDCWHPSPDARPGCSAILLNLSGKTYDRPFSSNGQHGIGLQSVSPPKLLRTNKTEVEHCGVAVRKLGALLDPRREFSATSIPLQVTGGASRVHLSQLPRGRPLPTPPAPSTFPTPLSVHAVKSLQMEHLLTFQLAMGKGPKSKLDWHDLVSSKIRKSMPKDEAKRQSIIFELISGEMTYLRDLENLETVFIHPLRNSNIPIIPPQRLNSWIINVFRNCGQLVLHHRRLLEQLHHIQQDEHPVVHSITVALLNALINMRDAYLEYVPNYPIAAYRIEEEKANNPRFKEFHDACLKHPDANQQEMRWLVNRPISRLLQYQLLMESILKETPADHDDRVAIPQLLEVIEVLGKETEPGVASAEQKVDLWRYNANLVFSSSEHVDMDLLEETRSLTYTGKLLRQPETGFRWGGWSELFVLLFDNYLVFTEPKEKDGITKYNVCRRPIPLELLTLATFTEPSTQRSTGLLRSLRSSGGGGGGGGDGRGGDTDSGSLSATESSGDSRTVYPCTIHHNGRVGGLYTLYAKSNESRLEWQQKLEEAIGLRKVVQESNKVFEIETLSTDTFLAPSIMAGPSAPAWNSDQTFTGKVTCSIPFNTADGRHLMAIGCAEGVWIGFRHDSRSLRRVLHLKMVTQCAMLDEFGIFLVLADKSLFAYHIEALVPSSIQSAQVSQTPQKLSGSTDVHFFNVGNLNNRTLVIYMKKKGLDSVFRALEPVAVRINNRSRTSVSSGSRLELGAQRSDWFRTYQEFFLPSKCFNLIFFKTHIAVLCTTGFEIMSLTDMKSATIPQFEDPRFKRLAKRCESCRPVGIIRSNVDEFLLCYDEFGLYVNRRGVPSRSTGTIDWEGTAERVAWHPPYTLLFDSRFIEVRHVETGRLAHIIPGNDIRCIWDGSGAKVGGGSADTPDNADSWGVDQEARVHAVMNVPPKPGNRARIGVQAQHVFELVPTVPLYLPERSPDASTYFPQALPLIPRHQHGERGVITIVREVQDS